MTDSLFRIKDGKNFPKHWQIERIIRTEEFKKLRKGCHIDIAFTRFNHKAYKLVGFLKRLPEDD